MRASTSAICSGVSALKPGPRCEAVAAADDVHGRDRDVGTFPPHALGNALIGLGEHRGRCWPRVVPGSGGNTSRTLASRSNGLWPPLSARWQSVHSSFADGVRELALKFVEVLLDQLELLVAADARAVLDITEVVHPCTPWHRSSSDIMGRVRRMTLPDEVTPENGEKAKWTTR